VVERTVARAGSRNTSRSIELLTMGSYVSRRRLFPHKCQCKRVFLNSKGKSNKISVLKYYTLHSIDRYRNRAAMSNVSVLSMAALLVSQFVVRCVSPMQMPDCSISIMEHEFEWMYGSTVVLYILFLWVLIMVFYAASACRIYFWRSQYDNNRESAQA
jgi:hypothetical protein